MRADQFSIGALSEATGVSIETIRYYEKIGLMPAPPRSRGRQRIIRERRSSRLHVIQFQFLMPYIYNL